VRARGLDDRNSCRRRDESGARSAHSHHCALRCRLVELLEQRDWSVAGSFGQRRFVELTPLLAIGLAAAIPSGQWPRRFLWGVVGVCVWWNLGLLVQFGAHRMDRQQLTLRDNAWQTFVELPRQAPSLAWRYLSDRDSFYRQPRQ
jgi:hypothetical protein